MNSVDKLMKEVFDLGVQVEKPDYPVQLFYSDGGFSAMFEPNYDTVLNGEGKTAEEALIRLVPQVKTWVENQKVKNESKS